jgi:hypothetical protein
MVDGGWWMACTERSRSVDGGWTDSPDRLAFDRQQWLKPSWWAVPTLQLKRSSLKPK